MYNHLLFFLPGEESLTVIACIGVVLGHGIEVDVLGGVTTEWTRLIVIVSRSRLREQLGMSRKRWVTVH
jgi:hypothetical protein